MPLSLTATDAELWAALLDQHQLLVNVSEAITAAAVETPTALLVAGTDSAWVLRQDHTHEKMCAYLCFIMSLGFALVGAGSVKALNTKNALIQSSYALLVSILAFWIVGFGLTTQSQTVLLGAPQSEASAIGDMTKAALVDEHYYARFLFLWSFVNACCCVVAVSVTSRMSMLALLMLIAVTAGFTFPLPAYWIWSSAGWMSARANLQFQVLDHAGGIVVHVVGGMAALTAAAIVGPRYDRFVHNPETQRLEDRKEPGHSVVFAVLGTFLLWFGWFGMNAGSSLGVTESLWQVAALSSINSVLAAGSGSLAMTAWHITFDEVHNLWELLNGILCGLVAITPGCAFVDPWAAVLIGTLSILPYRGGLLVLSWLRVDDIVDAFAVHACCGAFGTLMTGLLSTQSNLDRAYGSGVVSLEIGKQFGVQILAVCVVGLFAAAVTAALLLPLKSFNLLRVSREDEAVGLDGVLHGGYAYPDFKSKLLTAKNQVVLEAELGAALKKSAGTKQGSKDLALDVVTDKIRQLDEMRKAQTTGQAGGKRGAATTAMDAHKPENSMGAPVSKRDNYLGADQKSAMGPRASVQTRALTGRDSGALSIKGMHTATAAGGVHKYLNVDPMASINAGTPGNNMFFIPASPLTANAAVGVASPNDVHAFDAAEHDHDPAQHHFKISSSPSGPSGIWEHEGATLSPLGSPSGGDSAPTSPPPYSILLSNGQELVLPSAASSAMGSSLATAAAAPSSSNPSTPARAQKGARRGAGVHSRMGSTEMTEMATPQQQSQQPNSVVKIRIAPSPSSAESAAAPAASAASSSVRMHRAAVVSGAGGAGVSDMSSQTPAPPKPALRTANSMPSQSDTPGAVPERDSGETADRDSTPDGQEPLLDAVESLSASLTVGGTARVGDENATERRLRILKEEEDEV